MHYTETDIGIAVIWDVFIHDINGLIFQWYLIISFRFNYTTLRQYTLKVQKWYCNSYFLKLFIVEQYLNNIYAISNTIKNHVYLYFLVASIRIVFKSKVFFTKTPSYILLAVMPTDTSMFALQISTKSILFDFNEIVFEVPRHGRLVVFENHF